MTPTTRAFVCATHARKEPTERRAQAHHQRRPRRWLRRLLIRYANPRPPRGKIRPRHPLRLGKNPIRPRLRNQVAIRQLGRTDDDLGRVGQDSDSLSAEIMPIDEGAPKVATRYYRGEGWAAPVTLRLKCAWATGGRLYVREMLGEVHIDHRQLNFSSRSGVQLDK
jgi:hypothetical protein